MYVKIEVRTALVTSFRETSAMMFSPSFAEMLLMRRTEGPTITVGVPLGATPAAIAEAAWVVGNRMGRDDEGVAWPSNVRSMSTGDMVIMDDGSEVDGTPAITVAIAKDIGFHVERVNRHFIDSLADERSEQGPMGPWADDSDVVAPGQTDREAYAAHFHANA